ncbi:hypothetical protein [Poseidonocella sedimentorum]|uniref:Tetratricopeptide repeat-like domain-containing protein n=1 Tax=Poseidonocella sedimentorum TaxID=871652 RepID=A0A1I6EK69_9RHOB|nr:hypothetical protein [Poseidonocella sedimentorum]SFR18176.1 hypothetical protein SAMN04515673_11361 [Poseidonocella sedimentorum]
MSDTDTFIDEVSEEVRRDRLYKTMRRYGWIAVVLVLALVGGAAFNEYRKAERRAEAEALGDATLAALEAESPADRASALAALAEGDAAPVLALMAAAESLAAGEREDAVAALDRIATDGETSADYRQLAAFKALLLTAGTGDIEELRLGFATMAEPGNPYRLLAEEQLALLDLRAGDTEAAVSRLETMLVDAELSAGQRTRVSQLLVALGADGEPEDGA